MSKVTIKDLIIDHNASVGKTAIVRSVRAKFKYINGVRSLEQEGFSVDTVLPERDYNSLTVSVSSIPPELEQLNGNPVVQFENLTLFTYGPLTDLKVGAKADSVHIVGGKTKT